MKAAHTLSTGFSPSASTAAPNTTTQPPSIWRGVLLSACIAVVATFLGKWLPTIGGPVFAVLLGVVATNVFRVSSRFNPGIRFTAKNLLQWSIIGLGFGLSLKQVVQTGLDSLWVTLITIMVAFASAVWLGKRLGIGGKLRTMIGAGTAICGGSAIAAIAPIIEPEDHDLVFAISTIFLFNIVAVLVFPFMGHLLGMTDLGFGLWAGTAINDTSSVVAAAYSYSQQAGDYATIVKLTRASLIIPLCIGLSLLQARQDKKAGKRISLTRMVPWFIIGFVLASGIRSMNVLPAEVLAVIQQAVMFTVVMALSAVGLSTNFRQLARTGWRPIALGMGVWIAVSASSLAVQYGMGSW